MQYRSLYEYDGGSEVDPDDWLRCARPQRIVAHLAFDPARHPPPRLLTTRSSRISFSTASCRASLAGGGKCSKQRQLAADDPHRVQKGEPVRVLIGPQRRLVHQPAHREMRQQQAPELLPNQFWALTAQHDLRPAQMRLQFGKGALNFPALVIERGQFR